MSDEIRRNLEIKPVTVDNVDQFNDLLRGSWKHFGRVSFKGRSQSVAFILRR